MFKMLDTNLKKSQKSTLLLLLLLELMMNNCPLEFQIAIARFGFAQWMKKAINRIRFKARSQLKKVDLRIEMKMLQMIRNFAMNYDIYGDNSCFAVFRVIYDDLKASGATFPETGSGSESLSMELEGVQTESRWSWKKIFGRSKKSNDIKADVDSIIYGEVDHDINGSQLATVHKQRTTYNKVAPMLIQNFSETSDLFEDILGCLSETINSDETQASSIQRYIELCRNIKKSSLDPVFKEIKRRIPESGKIARSELEYMSNHIEQQSKTMELLIEKAKNFVMYSSPVKQSLQKSLLEKTAKSRGLPPGETSHDNPETLEMSVEPKRLRWDIRFNEKVTKRKILYLQNTGGCNLAYKVLTTAPDVHFVSPRQGYLGKQEEIRVKIYLDHPVGFARAPCLHQVRIMYSFLQPTDFFEVPVADFWTMQHDTKRVTIKCRWSKRSARIEEEGDVEGFQELGEDSREGK